jgi:hypothetical protein
MDAICFQEAVRANICELYVRSIGEFMGAEIALGAWNLWVLPSPHAGPRMTQKRGDLLESDQL